MSQDLTTKEAAEILEVSERTVRRMIDRETIYAYKLDPTSKSVYRIPDSEIKRILGEREKTQGGMPRPVQPADELPTRTQGGIPLIRTPFRTIYKLQKRCRRKAGKIKINQLR